MIKEAGAKEVHMRVSSPPITSPCFFGVDMATTSELIANQYNIEEIRKIIGADSLGFLSIDALQKSVNSKKKQLL